ncbi:hypothetical protein Scep_027256 [Stephania cephalantha]|uniref:Bromo domain-containing protein n=1 Tax=Stephania cephalantha TaxID=152367 RepID=A0AAP0E7S5_9MAGN
MAHTQVPGTFFADVKLTFSNAMKYNPYSTKRVHELALGEFGRMFTLEWKSLEAKWSVECLKTCEGQLSPSKSLRAAMLKSRFADMILKAQQKTLSTGDRVDPLKVKQERERFEKKRREDKITLTLHYTTHSTFSTTATTTTVDHSYRRRLQTANTAVILHIDGDHFSP